MGVLAEKNKTKQTNRKIYICIVGHQKITTNQEKKDNSN